MWGKEVSPEPCVALVPKAGNTITSSYDTVETRKLKERKYTHVHRCGDSPDTSCSPQQISHPDLTVIHDSDVESAGPNPLCSQSSPQKSSC